MTTKIKIPKVSCTTYSVPMPWPGWRRIRRRSLAPNRPVLFPEQYPLAILTLVVAVASIGFVVWMLVR
jgi:hypothetical protein